MFIKLSLGDISHPKIAHFVHQWHSLPIIHNGKKEFA